MQTVIENLYFSLKFLWGNYMTVPVGLHGEMQKKPIKGEGFQKEGLHKKRREIFEKKTKNKQTNRKILLHWINLLI